MASRAHRIFKGRAAIALPPVPRTLAGPAAGDTAGPAEDPVLPGRAEEVVQDLPLVAGAAGEEDRQPNETWIRLAKDRYIAI